MFQYTALDDCTRFRVLRLYRGLNQHSSLHFFGELRRAMSFPVRQLQTGRGGEFPLAFRQSVEAAGCGYRDTSRDVRNRTENRESHRIDHDHFVQLWQRHDFAELEAVLQAREHTYTSTRQPPKLKLRNCLANRLRNIVHSFLRLA